MAEDILIAVARAEQLRRRRLLTRLLLRIVPVVAGVVVVAAALIRVVHAPIGMFWMILAAAIAGLTVFAWIKGRVPAVTDAAATQLDADANLDGELRSAHWFASQRESNEWTMYHLARASMRVEDVSWPAVYPPVKTARAWAGSAALVLSAVAIVLSAAWPSAQGTARGGVSARTGASTADGELIPSDLQKQIDDLLKAVQSGAIPMDAAREKVSELRDALAALDPKLRDALAKAAAAQAKKPGGESKTDAKAAALAERAEKMAANSALPEDMKWSMQDLAAKLEKASRSDREEGADATSQEARASQKAGPQDAAGDKMQAASAQMTRTTATDAQSSQMMATMASPMGGEARGDTNDAAKKAKLSEPLDLSALRKETIQADSDSQGSNVLAEIRRKSEQSRSTIAFSHVAPLAAYDKSHATPPPPPPDALRPLVKQYFIRK